jgi:hypothetical protein
MAFQITRFPNVATKQFGARRIAANVAKLPELRELLRKL